MYKKWCMCETLKRVLRDMYSTCSICGGKDAYGTSSERPESKKKIVTHCGLPMRTRK